MAGAAQDDWDPLRDPYEESEEDVKGKGKGEKGKRHTFGDGGMDPAMSRLRDNRPAAYDPPPFFDGPTKDYSPKMWLADIEMWLATTKTPVREQGPLLYRTLRGDPRTEIEDIRTDVMESVNTGESTVYLIIEKIQAMYIYLEEIENTQCIEGALYPRGRDVKTEDFTRYTARGRLELRLLARRGLVCDQKILGYRMARYSRLSDAQHDKFSHWIDGDYSFELVCSSLRRLDRRHPQVGVINAGRTSSWVAGNPAPNSFSADIDAADGMPISDRQREPIDLVNSGLVTTYADVCDEVDDNIKMGMNYILEAEYEAEKHNETIVCDSEGAGSGLVLGAFYVEEQYMPMTVGTEDDYNNMLLHSFPAYQQVRQEITDRKKARGFFKPNTNTSSKGGSGKGKVQKGAFQKKRFFRWTKSQALTKIKCANCGELGHLARTCTNPLDEYRKRQNALSGGGSRSAPNSSAAPPGKSLVSAVFYNGQAQDSNAIAWWTTGAGLNPFSVQNQPGAGGFLSFPSSLDNLILYGNELSDDEGLIDPGAAEGLGGVLTMRRIDNILKTKYGLRLIWVAPAPGERLRGGIGGLSTPIGSCLMPIAFGGAGSGLLKVRVLPENIPVLIPAALLRKLGSNIKLSSAGDKISFDMIDVTCPLKTLPSGHSALKLFQFGIDGWQPPPDVQITEIDAPSSFLALSDNVAPN